MRIAIDGRTLTGRYTGDRTYWLNLIRAMVHQAPNDRFDVYSRAEIPEGDLPHSHNLTAYIVPAQNDRIWSMKALPNALRVNGADLLHVQYTIPGGCPCPVVTTIHDISYRLYPNCFPECNVCRQVENESVF